MMMQTKLSNALTRGHSLNLVKPSCHLDCQIFVFSHRVINTWNSLNEDTVASDSVKILKSRINKFMKCTSPS